MYNAGGICGELTNRNSVYLLLSTPTKSFRTLNLFSSQKTTTLP